MMPEDPEIQELMEKHFQNVALSVFSYGIRNIGSDSKGEMDFSHARRRLGGEFISDSGKDLLRQLVMYAGYSPEKNRNPYSDKVFNKNYSKMPEFFGSELLVYGQLPAAVAIETGPAPVIVKPQPIKEEKGVGDKISDYYKEHSSVVRALSNGKEEPQKKEPPKMKYQQVKLPGMHDLVQAAQGNERPYLIAYVFKRTDKDELGEPSRPTFSYLICGKKEYDEITSFFRKNPLKVFDFFKAFAGRFDKDEKIFDRSAVEFALIRGFTFDGYRKDKPEFRSNHKFEKKEAELLHAPVEKPAPFAKPVPQGRAPGQERKAPSK